LTTHTDLARTKEARQLPSSMPILRILAAKGVRLVKSKLGYSVHPIVLVRLAWPKRVATGRTIGYDRRKECNDD